MPNPPQLDDHEIEARSVLMRLYRSRIDGEAAYPARFVTEGNGTAPALEAKGWIERRADGWRITEAGVKAWATMSEPVTGHYGRCAWLNELYYWSGKRIQKIALTHISRKILQRLAERGGQMPLAEIEAMSGPNPDTGAPGGLPTLMRGMYVVIEDGVVRLSVVGELVTQEYGWLEKKQW